jgi:phosphoserine aminotransferase
MKSNVTAIPGDPQTVARVFNFSSGPAVLPMPVLEVAREHLLALPGIGMSVLEISHRSAAFDDILARAEASLRRLAGVPDDYAVLFLQGGASLQFSMVPMNLLAPSATADYIVTGSWTEKAVKEARRVGAVHVAATTKGEGFTRIPRPEELALTPGAAYVHITSNNTIEGTQWQALPHVGETPLVSDASSDILSRPLEVARHGLIYAGAQKNLGPAGVTIVIVRRDLLARAPDTLHTMLSYKAHADNGSRYNTPPVFGIYLIALVLDWLRDQGGPEAIGRLNARKAAALYDAIDRSGFYRGLARPESRSLMNVTFRLSTEALEAHFVEEATAAGLDGLAGHRSVGGIRASIYNAFPEEGIHALVQFMREFERRHG